MLPKIFFSNPIAQFESYKSEILDAVHRVLSKGPHILGPEVEAFEEEFAKFNNISYCVGVGSGTDALALALRAFDIGHGDEVITVSHTALATSAAIVLAGATPVLVDIENDHYTMDPLKLESAITEKTKAIIPVHLYGQPCDMDRIMTIAKRHNLIVIEDCAQAHGAIYKGRKVGTIGDVGCFSFYPTKNLGAAGDGGGIITKHAHIDRRVRQLRQYGWNENRVSVEPGVVSRLDELQAAILRVKLRYLEIDNQRRRDIAQKYDGFFSSIQNLQSPKVREDCEHVYHLYVIRSDERDKMMNELMKQGISAGIHYSHAVHMHPGYQDKIRVSKEGLEVTQMILPKILSLPMYPELDMNRIINQLGEIYV